MTHNTKHRNLPRRLPALSGALSSLLRPGLLQSSLRLSLLQSSLRSSLLQSSLQLNLSLIHT